MAFLIAEVGVNHNGRIGTAKRLADIARRYAWDAVKFQLFDAERLKREHPRHPLSLEQLKALEFNRTDMTDLKWHCDQIGIEFMCSAFHAEDIPFLAELGVKRLKIPSGCVKDTAMLEWARATNLPVILSTGMCDAAEVSAAWSLLHGSERTVLQCTSAYPCRLEDVNLRAMVELGKLGPYGLSDHSAGIVVPIAAAALGASVIEKHVTMDRAADGPDHRASILPHEMKALRLALVEVEAAMGDGEKRVTKAEEALREVWR